LTGYAGERPGASTLASWTRKPKEFDAQHTKGLLVTEASARRARQRCTRPVAVESIPP
jgi:hypothetical protein